MPEVITIQIFNTFLALTTLSSHVWLRHFSAPPKIALAMSPKQSDDRDPWLKKSVSMGEALALILSLAGVVIGVYLNIQVRLHDLETNKANNDKTTEEFRAELIKRLDKIDDKMGGMDDNIGNLRIELQNKADRK